MPTTINKNNLYTIPNNHPSQPILLIISYKSWLLGNKVKNTRLRFGQDNHFKGKHNPKNGALLQKLFKSCVYAITALLLLARCTPPNQTNDGKIAQIEDLLIFYPHKGEKQLESLLQNSTTLPPSKQHKIHYLKGLLALKKSETDSAIAHLQKALFYFTQKNNKLYMTKSILMLGAVAEKAGDTDYALQTYNEVVKTCTENRELGYAYLGYARCQKYLYGIKSTENFELNKGIELLKSLKKEEYSIYADFMDCFLRPKDNKHKTKLLKLAQRYLNIGIKESASAVYKSLSYIYLTENLLDSSEYYANIALPLSKSAYPTVSITPYLYQIKGKIDYRRKNYKEAEINFNHALALCDTFNQERPKAYIYKSMIKLYDAINDNKSDLKKKDKAEIIGKMLLDAKSSNQIKLKKLSLNLHLVKDELEKKKKVEYHEQKKILIKVLLLLATALTGLGLIMLYMHKKRKLAHTQFQWKQKLGQQEYERKKTMLKESLAGLGNSLYISKFTEEQTAELLSFLNDEPSPITIFTEAYSELIEAIKKKFANLSESDHIYAALLYLGQKEKTIAYLKRVNKNSVNKALLRMRGKLNLEKGTNLQLYFHNIIDIELKHDSLKNITKGQEQAHLAKKGQPQTKNPEPPKAKQQNKKVTSTDSKALKQEERKKQQRELWIKTGENAKKLALEKIEKQQNKNAAPSDTMSLS